MIASTFVLQDALSTEREVKAGDDETNRSTRNAANSREAHRACCIKDEVLVSEQNAEQRPGALTACRISLMMDVEDRTFVLRDTLCASTACGTSLMMDDDVSTDVLQNALSSERKLKDDDEANCNTKNAPHSKVDGS